MTKTIKFATYHVNICTDMGYMFMMTKTKSVKQINKKEIGFQWLPDLLEMISTYTLSKNYYFNSLSLILVGERK